MKIETIERSMAATQDNQIALTAALLVHRRALATYARMLAREPAAADDLLQDTWERALRCAHQFRPGTSLAAWLRRIMKNLFTDKCRAPIRFVPVNDQDTFDRLMAEDRCEEASEPDYRQFITTDDIGSALECLETSLREVFVLACMRGLSYQAIATTIGIPVATVGTRLWRARARIRTELARTAMHSALGHPVVGAIVSV